MAEEEESGRSGAIFENVALLEKFCVVEAVVQEGILRTSRRKVRGKERMMTVATKQSTLADCLVVIPNKKNQNADQKVVWLCRSRRSLKKTVPHSIGIFDKGRTPIPQTVLGLRFALSTVSKSYRTIQRIKFIDLWLEETAEIA